MVERQERLSPGEGLTWAIDRHFSSIEGECTVGGEQRVRLVATDEDGLVGGLPDAVWAVRPHPDLPPPIVSFGPRIETSETVLKSTTLPRMYMINQGSVVVKNGALQAVVLDARREFFDETTGAAMVLDPDAAWRFINWVGRAVAIPPDFG
ncbi:MAG TPA: hypothetical protein VLA88_04245 [Candidatus Saccharimonadales bacterium]|nr:hypothetical protein [Candidatus Saccharimonadales bacterium]